MFKVSEGNVGLQMREVCVNELIISFVSYHQRRLISRQIQGGELSHEIGFLLHSLLFLHFNKLKRNLEH